METVLPNFFMIGASKAGTTTLWHLLRQHPDIFMPEIKEPWFLSHDDRYDQLGWTWYESLFRPGSRMSAVGEASSCYCMTRLYPNALRRLGRYFPEARLIYCVREPYARIESAWKQCLSTRHPLPGDFSESVRTYPPILEGTRYGETLEAYLEVFPRNRIHIVLFHDLKRQPLETYKHCLEFLEVDPGFVPREIGTARNRSADKRVDTPAYLALRNSWFGRIGTRLTPTPVTRRIGKLLRRPMPDAVWTPQLREWVRQSLEQDTQRFLELSGMDANLWPYAR